MDVDFHAIKVSELLDFKKNVNDLKLSEQANTIRSEIGLSVESDSLIKEAVDKIRDQWDSVYVPPNPGDPGSCIGAVLAKTKTKIELDKQWYQKL